LADSVATMRILLMEDEPAIRSALARGLGQKGHVVEAVGSLAEARACYPHFQPEALVSDLKLPDGNGLEMAAELQIPFVLMTGYGTFDDAVRAMRLGGLDFFTKPVSIKDLCKALERAPSRQSSDRLVVAADSTGMRVARVQAGGFTPVPWQHATVTWHHADEAQQQFTLLQKLMPSVETRLITAELLQANTQGSLSINVHSDSWSVWLQAQVSWDQHSERRQLIESLGRNCTWAENGAIIECAHG
jgi:DNA-binding response OmpR family regulator